MKNLFIILFTLILLSFSNINVKGFNIYIDKRNMLNIYAVLERDVLSKEIEIKEKTGKNIYLYKKITCNKIQLKAFLPEGTYDVKTIIKYKNNKIIKNNIILKIKHKSGVEQNNK